LVDDNANDGGGSADSTETAVTDAEQARGRRGFLRYLGVSSAGVALIGAAHASKEKVKRGGEVTRAEIEKLKEDFDKLDRKTQLMLKLILALSGLDIFIA